MAEQGQGLLRKGLPALNPHLTKRKSKVANKGWGDMRWLLRKSTLVTPKWFSLMAVKQLAKRINNLSKSASVLEGKPLH